MLWVELANWISELSIKVKFESWVCKLKLSWGWDRVLRFYIEFVSEGWELSLRVDYGSAFESWVCELNLRVKMAIWVCKLSSWVEFISCVWVLNLSRTQSKAQLDTQSGTLRTAENRWIPTGFGEFCEFWGKTASSAEPLAPSSLNGGPSCWAGHSKWTQWKTCICSQWGQ